MIKIIQLLKESFVTYKANIKNIFWVTWPMLLLILIINYLNFSSEKKIIVGLLSFVCAVIIGLYLKPVLYRSLQKNENDKSFDTREAYAFQKKNIWNYIVLCFWSVVYVIKVNFVYILTIIISGIIVSVALVFLKTTIISFIILSFIMFACTILMIIKNITKFVLAQNIFFGGNIKPRDAVLASIEMGKKNNVDIWKAIFASILFNLLVFIIYLIIYLILVLSKLMSFEEIMNMNKSYLPITNTLVALKILTALVSVFVLTPISFIILAKTYNKLKTDEVVSDTTAEVI